MSKSITEVDVIIIGAGAAGLMCAIEAGKRGRNVVVLDHANKVGKKILMSGGGRCNFTNYYIEPEKYISQNPHFMKSALNRYTQWDFIELIKRHRIPFHEKTLGQLFCDNKAKDIVEMLMQECSQVKVALHLNTSIKTIDKNKHFVIQTNRGQFKCHSLVIASGGLSIPTMGASPFAYHVAKQFDVHVIPTRAGLVPFTLDIKDKERSSSLSGISFDSIAENQNAVFREHTLFTHRGLSGPAMLQLSSYWHPGQKILINLVPDHDLFERIKSVRCKLGQKSIMNFLSSYLPKRMIESFISIELREKKLGDISNHEIRTLVDSLQKWRLTPSGTEGYRTAEVTLGGIDCHEISSKSMEVLKVKNLYFIGEALDVSGWLGGYNFQWAWSSGWAAGQEV